MDPFFESQKKTDRTKSVDGMFEQDITGDRTVKGNSEIEGAKLFEGISKYKSIGGRSAIQVLVSTLASRRRSVCKQ